MNVSVEKKPNCLTVLSIEMPAERVASERKKVTDEFVRHARVPGFRPGKTPRSVIESRFAKGIREELEDQLLRDGLREAIADQGIVYLSVEHVTGKEMTPEGGFRFEATLVTEPEFELPDYSKIPLEIAREPITEEMVDKFLESLREAHATFDLVEGRAAALGDFAVITYAGRMEGVPLAEVIADVPAQIAGKRNAWLLLTEDALAPGFAAQIVGSEPGANKSFPLVFPEDFVVESLRGKTVDYEVTLHSINAKNLPEWNDELAAKIEPESPTLEALRRSTRERYEKAVDSQFEGRKRQEAVRFLLQKFECDLPERYVHGESLEILRDIVQENLARGISSEELQKNEDELVGLARESARERVRRNFLLLRIAKAEKIEATQEELAAFAVTLAQQYEIPTKKFLADLKKRNGFEALWEQILIRKTLDFLTGRVVLTSPDAAAKDVEAGEPAAAKDAEAPTAETPA